MTARRIYILDDRTINQIAAGEVIENPASAVKELIENALDAEATAIEVSTEGGGRGLIRVSDNGSGMGPDDLLLSFERHATSKLNAAEELKSLRTLGFRGEALASIASISKMTMHSALDQEMGHKVVLSGGKIENVIPFARRRGTTIEVRSLFFNTPVRKSFQKSVASDRGEIYRVLTLFALSYPQIEWSWIDNGKLQLHFLPSSHLSERIELLFGNEVSQNLLHVEHFSNHLELRGAISHPFFHRPNRMGHYLFINRRAIYSKWIGQKILESYGTRLPPHRYPFFVLDFSLPPEWIDVNVHPQKKEIRFKEEQALISFIHHAIIQALEREKKESACPALFCAESSLEYHATPSSERLPGFEIPLAVKNEQDHIERASYFPLYKEEQLNIGQKEFFSVIANFKHFFIIQNVEEIRIINLKYALERIIYEELCARKESQKIQSLLIPIQKTFVGKERELIEESIENLNQAGISIRHFGGDTYIIDAIPATLEMHEISDLIDLFLQEGTVPKKVEKILKRTIPNRESAQALIERLFQCQTPDFTPDGKPIQTVLNEKNLNQLFTMH